MSKLLWITILALQATLSNGKVICTLEEYVRTGTEFSQCQEKTLNSFRGGSKNCPAIHEIVYNCANTVKQCFDERGWQRGRQVFVELLALQYPDENDCDVFLHQNDTDVPQQLKGEACSIDEEVVLITNLRICNNQQQTEVVNSIMHHHTSIQNHRSTAEDIDYFVYPTLCEGLQEVSSKCFEGQLDQCYDSHDIPFHMTYMLEELKVAGIVLATHLMSNSSKVDVVNCPVFRNSPIYKQRSFQANTIVVLVVTLTVILLALLLAFVTFLAQKFRLIPRLSAWIQNEPYQDFVVDREMSSVTQQQPKDDREIAAVAQEPLPTLAEIKGEPSKQIGIRDRQESESGAPST